MSSSRSRNTMIDIQDINKLVVSQLIALLRREIHKATEDELYELEDLITYTIWDRQLGSDSLDDDQWTYQTKDKGPHDD